MLSSLQANIENCRLMTAATRCFSSWLLPDVTDAPRAPVPAPLAPAVPTTSSPHFFAASDPRLGRGQPQARLELGASFDDQEVQAALSLDEGHDEQRALPTAGEGGPPAPTVSDPVVLPRSPRPRRRVRTG